MTHPQPSASAFRHIKQNGKDAGTVYTPQPASADLTYSPHWQNVWDFAMAAGGEVSSNEIAELCDYITADRAKTTNDLLDRLKAEAHLYQASGVSIEYIPLTTLDHYRVKGEQS